MWSAEAAGRDTDALAAYRACLFDEDRERDGVDRHGLYLAIARTARRLRPSPEVPERASEALRQAPERALPLAPWWADAHFEAAKTFEARRDKAEAVLHYEIFLAAADDEDGRPRFVARHLKALQEEQP